MTELLVRAGEGDRDALDAVLPMVYGELRRLAQRQLAQQHPDHTLSPTALVHEAWLRFSAEGGAAWESRAHFFALAATAMRRILVDHARRHGAAKRGGSPPRVSLEQAALTHLDALQVEDRADVLVALDESLARLALLDARQARVIECRFFGGLTEEETAEALDMGLRTVKRDWAKARAWLLQDLRDADSA